MRKQRADPGEGKVTDPVCGMALAIRGVKHVVDHGPVEAVDWPAMAMAFQADEGALQKVSVGDEVTFSFRMSDTGNEITSIEKR